MLKVKYICVKIVKKTKKIVIQDRVIMGSVRERLRVTLERLT